MNVTQMLILMITAILLIYDVYAMPLGQPTESMVFREWAWKANTVPFIWGFLMGHWFMPRQHVSTSGWMYALPIMVSLIVYDVLYNHYGGTRRWFRYPIWFVLFGIPVGAYLWGQGSAESPLW